MIQTLKFNDVSYGYFVSEKLSNGQSISIFFFHKPYLGRSEYSVVLAIANKKKHIKEWIIGQRDLLSDQETGRCGLEGLLWAKRQLKAFEEHVWMCHHPTIITVDWTDNRRQRVYARGLKSVGYEIKFHNGRKCLYKKVEKTS